MKLMESLDVRLIVDDLGQGSFSSGEIDKGKPNSRRKPSRLDDSTDDLLIS